MRLAPPLLRFSCGAGLSVLAFGLVFLGSPGDLRADGGAAASPDDMALDLGGMTLDTRRVPHGSFTQGAPASEVGHDKEEEPAHHVTITKDFWIGKFPVTRGQFAKFVADTRYVSEAEKGQAGGAGWAGAMVPDGGKGPVLVQKKEFTWRAPGFTQTDEHPVVLVSYGDANAFVGWASRKTGKRVRLPTESEWELASRAGTTTSWSGGTSAESDPGSYGWFKPNAGNGTRPVGQKKPNPLGLFDMSGNVMEWCRDVYAPYREGALIDPEVATNTGTDPERRVLRGGSWFRDPKRGRSAARYKNTPGSRNADNGFRVVVTNEEMVTPGVTGPGPDFVPASPLGAAALPGPGVQGGASSSSGGGSSGPLADGEPLRTEPVGHPGDAFSWGLLLASPVAGASAVVAWMLLRRKKTRRSTKAAPNAVGVSTRAAGDGFFVSLPGAAAGTRVRFQCVVGGRQVADVVPVVGGKETFVHTGAAPTAIRILGILPVATGSDGGDRAVDRPLVAPRVPPPPPSSSAGVERRPSRAPPLPAAARKGANVPNVPNVPSVPNVPNVTTQPMHPPHRESPRAPYAASESVIVAPSPSPGFVDAATAASQATTSESATAAAAATAATATATAAAAAATAAAATSEAMAAAETLSTSAMTSADAMAAVAPIPPPNEHTSADESAGASAKGADAAPAQGAATAPPEGDDAVPANAAADAPVKTDAGGPLKAESEAPTKADADADAQADADADAQADADAPAQADADADAPAKADADAPAPASRDAAAPARADADAPTKADADEPAKADTDAAAPAKADMDADEPAKADADVDAPAKADADADVDAPSKADADAPAKADADAPKSGDARAVTEAPRDPESD